MTAWAVFSSDNGISSMFGSFVAESDFISHMKYVTNVVGEHLIEYEFSLYSDDDTCTTVIISEYNNQTHMCCEEVQLIMLFIGYIAENGEDCLTEFFIR